MDAWEESPATGDDRADQGAQGPAHRQEPRIGDVGEQGVLAEVFAALADGHRLDDRVPVGPGDDTAQLRVAGGAVLATTDAMVRGHDWRDDWSGPTDVGVKLMTQNLADLAAMGGFGTGVLVTLVADPELPLRWARGLAEGLAWAGRRAGVPVLGGDLSAAPAGVVTVSVTALGELGPGVDAPVLRSGARPGDVLACSGPLGRSAAGLELLAAGHRDGPWVDYHRRPLTDLSQGPRAARSGARAMIDVSDGLGRDADRVARASGVLLVLDPAAVDRLAVALTPALGAEAALRAVLGGGEEHELLAAFPPGAVPSGWIEIGRVQEPGPRAGPGVLLGTERLDPGRGGWDHFSR